LFFIADIKNTLTNEIYDTLRLRDVRLSAKRIARQSGITFGHHSLQIQHEVQIERKVERKHNLLVEDGLSLTTKTRLLPVVTALT
jgi:hypothetical protein